MDTVPLVLAGLGGIVLGMLLTSRLIGWVQAIVEARRTTGGTSAPMIMVVLLHSGPWLLLATLVGGFFALSRSDAEGWTWFLSGVVIAPLVLIPAAIVISRRSANSTNAAPEAITRGPEV